MQLGDLDRRITIEQYTTTTDDYGQRTRTWSTYREVWAKLNYESGAEDYEADQKTANRVVKFIIRYDDSITEKMRVNYNGYYDIMAIEEVGRERYLVLRCEKNDKS